MATVEPEFQRSKQGHGSTYGAFEVGPSMNGSKPTDFLPELNGKLWIEGAFCAVGFARAPVVAGFQVVRGPSDGQKNVSKVVFVADHRTWGEPKPEGLRNLPLTNDLEPVARGSIDRTNDFEVGGPMRIPGSAKR